MKNAVIEVLPVIYGIPSVSLTDNSDDIRKLVLILLDKHAYIYPHSLKRPVSSYSEIPSRARDSDFTFPGFDSSYTSL